MSTAQEEKDGFRSSDVDDQPGSEHRIDNLLQFDYQLARERKMRGWSQADVAAHIGSDTKTVGRWERGETLPTPYFQYKLLQLFGKDAKGLGLIEKKANENTEQREEKEPQLLEGQADQRSNQQNLVIEIERENQLLGIERQRLELLEKRLEVQKREIDYALEIGGKIIDTLHPNADVNTRAEVIRALLPELLQFLSGKGLALDLLHSSEVKTTKAEHG